MKRNENGEDAMSFDKNQKRTIDDLYNILGNIHRRRIILFLGSVGEAGFTELRRHLGISVGTLYYNLDNLRGLVIQKPNRKYTLSERGKRVYEIISREVKRIEEMYREPHIIVKFYNKYIGKFIAPIDLFTKMYKKTLLTTVIGLGVLAIGILGLNLNLILGIKTSRLDITILDFNLQTEIPSGFSQPIWLSLKLLGSWLLIVIISTVLAKLFGSRIERPEIISALMIAITPTLAYPYIYYLFVFFNLFSEWIFVLLSNIILRILQIITVGFLSASISVFSGISLERAFFIAFIVIYLSLALSFLL